MGQRVEVEFRVLGTVEARAGAQTAHLTRMQRSLLAILLLKANRVVPGAGLVDGLWGGQAPASASARVRMLVADLRRALGDIGAASDLITTRSAGYMLRLDDVRLDSVEFSQGVARAREAFAFHRWDEAGQWYSSALALWRGPALSDAQGPVAEAEAARLEEERASAVEGAADVDLALGRCREAVVALTDLISRHPLRDGPHGRLMLALHRMGRSSEALEVFRSMHSRYTEELGIEPGNQLQELHQRILRADPALLQIAPRPEQPAPAPAGPAQLPPDISDFSGRGEQVSAAVAELASTTTMPVLAVYGKPGVGKTALAVHIAHRIRPQFPGGQLHVDLHGDGPQPADPHEVLARFLGALGVPGDAIPDKLADRTALYRSRTADQRVLVVLDNAAEEAQVLPLLPGTAGCAVIVTSRAPLAVLPGARRLALDLLETDACERMLAAILGEERTSAERAHVGRLIELCGRLPLALRIAAGRLAAQPHWLVRTLVDRLADERHRLDELSLGGIEVRASLELSRQALPAVAAKAFAALGLLPTGEFGAWALAALSGTSVDEAERRLDTLVQVQLVEYARRDSAGRVRYRLHDLIRAYVVELAAAGDAGERRAATGRLNGTWVVFAADVARRLSPRRSPSVSRPVEPWLVPGAEDVTADADAWLESEWRNLVTAVEACVSDESELDRSTLGLAWQVAASMSTVLESRGYFDDLRTLNQCGLHSAERVGDVQAEAAMRCGLAAVELAQYDLTAARQGYEKTLAMYQELADDWGCAQAEYGMAKVLRWTDDIDGALALCERAAQRFRSAGDGLEAAHVDHRAAVIHYERGDWDQAAALAESSLPVFTEAGDRFNECVTWGVLGLAIARQGDTARGEQYLRHALTVADEAGLVLHRAYAGGALGEHLVAQGRYAEARTLFEAGLEVMRTIGVHAGEAGFLRRLARVEAKDGQADTALTLASRAVAMTETTGGGLYAHSLWALGDVHAARGDEAQAAIAWRHSRDLFDKMGSKEGPA